MKTRLIVLITALFFTVNGLVAQNRQRTTPEERSKTQTEALVKALELNDKQKQKIYDIILRSTNERQASMTSSSDMSREQRMEAFQKIQNKQTEDIKTLLTDDQKPKYDKFLKESQNRTRNNGRRGNR